MSDHDWKARKSDPIYPTPWIVPFVIGLAIGWAAMALLWIWER